MMAIPLNSIMHRRRSGPCDRHNYIGIFFLIKLLCKTHAIILYIVPAKYPNSGPTVGRNMSDFVTDFKSVEGNSESNSVEHNSDSNSNSNDDSSNSTRTRLSQFNCTSGSRIGISKKI